MAAECPELFCRCLGNMIYSFQLAFTETHPFSYLYGKTIKEGYLFKALE